MAEIAFSDWEAVKLSLKLRKEKREKKALDMASSEETGKREVKGEPYFESLKEMPLSETEADKVFPKEDGFADPWPGQNIEFVFDVIREKGFVSSEQTVLSGVKGYTFYKADGTGRFLRFEVLVAQKMARKA